MPKVTASEMQKDRPTKFYDFSDQGYFDTAEFKIYTARVESFLTDNPYSNTHDIHKFLSTERQHWTMDALEHITGLQVVPGIVDRYYVDKERAAETTYRELHDALAAFNNSQHKRKGI